MNRTTLYDLGPAAEQLGHLVQGAKDEDLSAPTPCEGWSVADLLGHIAGLGEAFTSAGAKRPVETPGHSHGLAPGWRSRVPRQLAELVAAWRREEAWTGETQAGGVRMPAEQMGVVVLDELVLHSWDLARATRQTFMVRDLDAAACLAFAEAMSQPGQADRRAGLYGPVVPVSADAPILYRLLGASGRRPTWSRAAAVGVEVSAGVSAEATFFLVPGAWMGGWVWQDMVDRLQAAGHRARTTTLTGLEPGTVREHVAAVDLRRHVQDVVRELEREDLREVVLVAHSYSGVVVGQVADQVPERIRRCIHVASFLPRDGRSLLDDWGDDETMRAQERQQVLDEGMLWAPPPPAALAQVADLAPEARRWLSERLMSHPGRTVLDPVALTRPVTDQPVTYVATAPADDDPLAHLPRELTSAMPAEWRLRAFTSGHWPMASHPAQLQQLLIEESHP